MAKLLAGVALGFLLAVGAALLLRYEYLDRGPASPMRVDRFTGRTYVLRPVGGARGGGARWVLIETPEEARRKSSGGWDYPAPSPQPSPSY